MEPILTARGEAEHSVREGGELRGVLRMSTPTSFGKAGEQIGKTIVTL
jgi:hypothetical protein